MLQVYQLVHAQLTKQLLRSPDTVDCNWGTSIVATPPHPINQSCIACSSEQPNRQVWQTVIADAPANAVHGNVEFIYVSGEQKWALCTVCGVTMPWASPKISTA